MPTHKKTPTNQKTILIILGLFLCGVLLEVGLRIGGFNLLSQQEDQNRDPNDQNETYRIMCLGDFTTFLGGGTSYPSQLERILNKRNLGIKFKVINKGVSEATSTNIVKKLGNNIITHNPDMIIVMMGINDAENSAAYTDIHSNKALLFFKSLKIYKLAKFLRLHNNQKLEEKKLAETEETLKKTLELNPIYDDAYIELAEYYRDHDKWVEAEELLKKALEINPENEDTYYDLAEYYWYHGKDMEAEKLLKKALEINPENGKAYLALVERYSMQGKLVEAEEILKKALERNPESADSHINLAEYYGNQGRLFEAEELLKSALEIDPKYGKSYHTLAELYWKQDRLIEAEDLLKKTLKIDPKIGETYFTLAEYYWDNGKITKAEKLIKRAIKIYSGDELFQYQLSAFLYNMRERGKAANIYSQQIKKIDAGWYKQATIRNYQMLKDTITDKGIKLVSMQYPILSVKPLKKIFHDKEGLVFVDNEKIFKEAVAKENYEKYFIDNDGGNFGRFTAKGNELLAENAAKVISKEFFGK